MPCACVTAASSGRLARGGWIARCVTDSRAPVGRPQMLMASAVACGQAAAEWLAVAAEGSDALSWGSICDGDDSQ